MSARNGRSRTAPRRAPTPAKGVSQAQKAPNEGTRADVGPKGAKTRPYAVEMRPIARISPYPANAKAHSEEAVAKLATLIRRFGFRVPIVVDKKGVIVKGHRTWRAAQSLGMREVPTHIFTGTATEARAWRLADNRVAQDSGWDDGLLRTELGELQAEGFDLALTGFGAEELEALLHPSTGLKTGVDPDDVPPLPEHPVTVPGDLIVLGPHRLLCGDATVSTDVGRLLNGVRPMLMVTDPPYGVEYDADWRNRALRADGSGSDGRAVGPVTNDERNDWREAWALFPGDVAYCWHADRHASSVQASLEAAGFEIRCQVIWAKSRFAIGRGDYHWQHEPCWYAVRKGRKGHWQGSRSESTLWEIQHLKSETGHSTQKPVECMRRPVDNNSSPGQAVYDPFVGSGTTLIACEMTGRACYAMEISPAYCDVIVQRWEQATGQTAQRPERAA